MQTRLIVRNDNGTTLMNVPIKSIEFDDNSLLCEFGDKPKTVNGETRRSVPRRRKRTAPPILRRTQNGSKLSADQVRAIRKEWRAKRDSLKAARKVTAWMAAKAKQLGVSQTSIQFICYRLTWRHVR